MTPTQKFINGLFLIIGIVLLGYSVWYYINVLPTVPVMAAIAVSGWLLTAGGTGLVLIHNALTK
jgi:uncharacterized membrane protein